MVEIGGVNAFFTRSYNNVGFLKKIREGDVLFEDGVGISNSILEDHKLLFLSEELCN